MARTASRGSAPRKRAERDQPPKRVRRNRTAKGTRRAASQTRPLEHQTGQSRSPKRTTPQSRFPARGSGPGQFPKQRTGRGWLPEWWWPSRRQLPKRRTRTRTTSRSPVPRTTTERDQLPKRQHCSPPRAKDRGQAGQHQSPERPTEPNQQTRPPNPTHEQHRQHLAVPPARRTSAVRPPRQVGVPRGHGPRGTRPRRTWRPSSCSGGAGRRPEVLPPPRDRPVRSHRVSNVCSICFQSSRAGESAQPRRWNPGTWCGTRLHWRGLITG